MQFAYGKLRLHVIGNIFFIFVLIPSVIWASLNYGATGTGCVWFADNLMFMLVWTWIVHRNFAPGLHWKWIGVDVLPIALCTLGVSSVIAYLAGWPTQRLQLASHLIFYGLLSLVAAFLSSSYMRRQTLRIFEGRIS